MKSDNNTDKPFFNTSEVAKIAETSRNSVNKYKNGEKLDDEELQSKLEFVFGFEKTLKQMITHKNFYEMCEVAISKSRNVEVRKFATVLQRMSMNIKYKLDINPEDIKKDYLD